MQIVYLILAHKNPAQLWRLVNRLDYNNVIFFIHIDKKVEDISSFTDLTSVKRNIHYIKRRVNTNWGAYSLVQATLNGIKEVLEYTDKFDYLCLLSGMDYPIKKNKDIIKFFIKNKGKEFLYFDSFPTTDLPNGGMDRIEYYYDYDNEITKENQYEIEMKKKGIKRKYLENMKPYHGAQWWSLTSGCIKYIINCINNNKEITNFFRYTRFPDEQFFQTIIMNSKFSRNVINDNLRYIDWSTVDWSVLDWIKNPPHPKILTTRDFSALLKSKKIFARKFDENIDKIILDEIDCKLLN